MFDTESYYLKDSVTTTIEKFGYLNPQPAIDLFDPVTKKNKINYNLYVTDTTFDNEDNPYGKFVLHQYTNMEDKFDTKGNGSLVNSFLDIEIPMERCEGMEVAWRNKDAKYYCPVFDESHFMHGGFWGEKYSWLRLALHICDNRPEAQELRKQQGKTHIECATREESLNYFEQEVITGIDGFAPEANINKNYSKYLYSRPNDENIKYTSMT